MLKDTNLTIQFGTGLSTTFFYPRTVLNYFMKDLSLKEEDLTQFAKSLLTTYIFLGCDHNPSFTNISHAFGLLTFAEVCQEKIPSNVVDFLKLSLKMYENKNKGIRRLFQSNEEMEINERIMEGRSLLKSLRGVESECLPLPSILRQQYTRANFLAEFLTCHGFKENPTSNGWLVKDGLYEIRLQDENDPFYKVPKDMMIFCSCKSKCTDCCKCKKG